MFRSLGERTIVKRAERRAQRRAERGTGEGSRRYESVASNDMVQRLRPAAKERKQAAQAATTERRPVHLRLDLPLLLIILTLVVFGLVILFSASYDYSRLLYGDPYNMIRRQLMFVVLGIGLTTIFTIINYHWYQKWAVFFILGTIGLLVAVLFLNNVLNNAVRTLFGPSVQPSELAKLVIIIYLAVWLYSKRDVLSDATFGLYPLILILGTVGGLIFLQPDLSAALTVMALGGIMFFLAGGEWRQIGFMLVGAAIVGLLVVQVSATGSQRIQTYMMGLQNPIEASYHVRRSLEAFVQGGWFGVGIGRSQTKLTGLPVPPTDSIFAVVGEETGFFGSAMLVSLYTMLLWRGLTIARRAPDQLGSLLAAGLSIWIAMEAFVNMAVMVNLLPFAGNALPFVSSGGSSMVVSLVAIGILLNISRQGVENESSPGRLFGAVIDLRRWDRRRRVSRPVRTQRPSKES